MSFQHLMHPKHSKIEWEILEDLAKEDLHPMMDKSFCVLSTTPDFYFPNERLAVYVDGEKVHLNRQDKDEWLRELLAKRHGVKVLSIPYKRFSKRKSREIVEKIKEALQKES